MPSSTKQFVAAVICAALSATLLAQPAESSPDSRERLLVTSFNLDAVSGVLRDEPLVIRFSSKVRRRSVDERTVRITANAVPVEGARIAQGNVVRFDPTRTQANYEASRVRGAQVEPDRPEGFDANTVFTLVIPGEPELHVVRNARGRLRRTFASFFATGARYLEPAPPGLDSRPR